MKWAAQQQRHGLGSIPRTNDDGSAKGKRAQRLVERRPQPRRFFGFPLPACQFGEPPGLFLVYPQGNPLRASDEERKLAEKKAKATLAPAGSRDFGSHVSNVDLLRVVSAVPLLPTRYWLETWRDLLDYSHKPL